MTDVATVFTAPPEALAVEQAVRELVNTVPGELVIETRAEAQRATDLLAAIARQKREAESARKALTKPLNDHVKFINSTFGTKLEPLANPEAVLRAALLAFQTAEEEKAKEAQRKADEAAQAERERLEAEAERQRAVAMLEGMPEDPDPVPVPEVVAAKVVQQNTVHGLGGTAHTRKTWDFEVEDVSMLPRAFIQPNEQAIRAAVKAGERTIPGVRIFEKSSLAVRA